jgi:predicted MPP superfamily phosphohydrolase
MNALRFALFHLVFDVYMFFALKSLFKDQRSIWIFSIIYILASAVTYFSFYKLDQAMQSRSMFRGSEVNLYIGIIITSLITKMVFSGLMFMQDIIRVLIGAGKWIAGLFGVEKVVEASFVPGRRNFLTLTAAGIAAIPFSALIYGLSKGKYRYTLEQLKLSFANLPRNFNNFKIVQISDIHAGSFDSREQVMKGIQLVNDQDPDIILFTGDLVNSNKDEIDPYIDLFAQLKAKHGKYAILGNHDYYGTYDMKDQQEVDKYWASFMEKYKTIGFDLLKNEHRVIEIDGEKISLLGVENWGAGRWFPKHGDLDLAMPDDDSFKILMSHDPTHWDEKVLSHKKHIDLTLAGHTHGFQFGINFPGFKWSPAQYRYKHWMGLYEEKDQYLYVNRGFGFLGFPGRVGMWPEVTVLELSSEFA